VVSKSFANSVARAQTLNCVNYLNASHLSYTSLQSSIKKRVIGQ
jgi:hypothetical protein